MNNKNTRQKRGIVPMLSVVAAVLGVATASFVFATIGGTPSTPNVAAITVPSETTAPQTETPTTTPTTTPTPTTDEGSTPDATNGNGNTKPSTGNNGSTKPTKPSNGGSTGGSTGGNTTPVKPKPTNCPNSRSDDPALWDACRAGYVAPKIEFAGLVSCTATDSTKENWSLTYAFRLSGGNYAKYAWSNSGGKTTITVKGYPIDGASDTYPLIARADVEIYPMNGLNGVIDSLEFSQTVTVPIGQFCK